ncbi:MAG: Tricarballylate dehydrogenase, TcuA [Pseudolabrys sp.]|jgi:tricarballylate dehydrogenase|nr:Tricarballylate dehydrogenase, TcuA [Pseudolabrys sp.]
MRPAFFPARAAMDLAQTFDVVIAGGGNAALCAAITAARAGRSVIVVEGAPKFYRGGNTRHTRNVRVAQDGTAPTMTGAYEPEEFYDDLMRVTGGQTDTHLARMTIVRSQELLPWLGEQGVKFGPPLGGTLSLGRTNAFFLGGGRGEINSLYRTAEALGVRLLYEAPVVAMNIDNGFFVSLTVKIKDQAHEVKGRSLVAAAGGFEANIEWLKRHWGPAADNFLIRGTPYNRGDVLRMLLDKGVMPTGDPTQCHAVAIDARAPRFDGGIATRLDSIIFGVVVNKNAERFYDEGEDLWPKRYAIWGRLIAQQPDQIAYSIVDVKSINLFMPSIFTPVTAQTIPQLADKLGLNPAALDATVSAFNAAVKPGAFDHTRLDDCRTEGLGVNKTHWARTIDQPPFYAYPLRPGITFTYLGVKVDDEGRMTMSNGRPAGNMFAAGEIMAGNVLGKGYLAGIGMTIGAVFGRLAGQGAANHVRN